VTVDRKRASGLLFLEMARIGATSFGGGAATVLALRRLCLRRNWMTERDFADTVVLSRLTPGISILAQVLLIGRRVAGVRGAVAATAGMLLPALVITIALAKGYTAIRSAPAARMPLQLVSACAAGFAVAMAAQLLRDSIGGRRRWLPMGWFAVYLAFTLAVPNPLILLGLAVAVGVVVPAAFARSDDDER
jgi:chromate transporter